MSEDAPKKKTVKKIAGKVTVPEAAKITEKEVNVTLDINIVNEAAPTTFPAYRPLYWQRVCLGGRLILGIISLPLFVLGLCVAGFRKLVGKIRRKA
jgi:hypothetical protein